MAKKSTPAADAGDDLLGGAGDDLLAGDKPAAKKAAAKKTAAPAKKAAPAKAEKAAPAKAEKAAPAKKAKPAKEASGERSARGTGKFYMDMEEKADLAKKIGASKKPISTAELAEKFQVETWKVRRAINEILVKEGKGSVEKVGTTLTYNPS